MSKPCRHVNQWGDGSVRLLAMPRDEVREVDQATVRKLIAQLDDEEFAVRVAAQQKLMELGSAVTNELQTAAKESKSREVQFRVRLILTRLAESGVKLVKDFNKLPGTVMSVKFSPDHKMLAACSRLYRNNSGQIVVWELSRPEQAAFAYTGVGTNSLAFSSDGKHLASADQDGAVTVWAITKSS